MSKSESHFTNFTKKNAGKSLIKKPISLINIESIILISIKLNIKTITET